MPRQFRTVDYEATLDSTVRLRDLLPDDHLARFVADLVAADAVEAHRIAVDRCTGDVMGTQTFDDGVVEGFAAPLVVFAHVNPHEGRLSLEDRGCDGHPGFGPARLDDGRVVDFDEPFFDDLQGRTFRFFWETTNPANGLTPDRFPKPPFASIASVGFALTAYPIGVERGWITTDDAAKVQAECDAEASDAADWAEQQPDPIAEDALTNVFA